MLYDVDLDKKLRKDEFDRVMPGLRMKMGALQRAARDAGTPIVIVLEGWDAVRMAFIINQLLLSLDPRGFSYYNIGAPDKGERERPFLWRFWIRTPTKGRIAIFDRSWYSRTVAECLDNGKCKHPPAHLVKEIIEFEKGLTDDGFILIKLFIHSSKKSEKEKSFEKEELWSCGLIRDDLDIKEHYEKYLPMLDDMLENTNTPNAPWSIVESDDIDYGSLKLLRTVIEQINNSMTVPHPIGEPIMDVVSGDLDREKLDLSMAVGADEYKEKLSKYQGRLRGVQCDLFQQKKRLYVVLEGRDASGKGGNIARITQTLNPRTYDVIPVTAPNDNERAHNYLWRFYNAIPLEGHLVIFDRSWYGRVLVERVDKLASDSEWKRAYHEINEFENVLTKDGDILVKIWLEIDRSAQLQRFNERTVDPEKTWKITPDDWKAREEWDDYSSAIDEMIKRTSTSNAPWTLVESNNKEYSRLKTLDTILKAAEKGLGSAT